MIDLPSRRQSLGLARHLGLLVGLLLVPSVLTAQEVFYVDPTGNDADPGTASEPLRTFAGAVQRVRTVLDEVGDVEVRFRFGAYRFAQTVVLGPADSGTDGQGITYRADDGATPVFAQLGREAIVLSGRAPARGDVHTGNVIRGNRITATGREKWTAPAIVLDQSSNNRVESNLIQSTDFSAIVLTAPRQLAMLSHGEAEGPPAPEVREFHYQDIPASVADFVAGFGDLGDGAREAMQFVYNRDNVVRGNALIDVSRGRGFLVDGYVYVSGFQRLAGNELAFNYLGGTVPPYPILVDGFETGDPSRWDVVVPVTRRRAETAAPRWSGSFQRPPRPT